MAINIDPELKEYIIEQHLRYGRTLVSLADEYGYSRSIIGRWCKKFQQEAAADAEKATSLAAMEENLRLRKQVAELEKEVDFLKKAAAFFAKESK